MPSNPLVVKTIVTTDLQAEIAKFYGCHVDETLTGFKWICHLIEQYENGTRKPQRTFVCGGEESYGFLAGNFVRDKDGIAACVIAAEMTAYYLSKGLTLDKVLDQIFRRHGVYHETLSTMTLPGKTGAEQIKAMMQHLRELPPKEICGTLVERVSDIQAGFSCHPNDPKQRQMIDLPKSDVLQLQLSDLSRISIRPSGTEPKIKFYVSARTAIDPDCTERELDLAKVRCQQRAQDIEKAFFAMATNHS
jgi:phosphoglucomutase